MLILGWAAGSVFGWLNGREWVEIYITILSGFLISFPFFKMRGGGQWYVHGYGHEVAKIFAILFSLVVLTAYTCYYIQSGFRFSLGWVSHL